MKHGTFVGWIGERRAARSRAGSPTLRWSSVYEHFGLVALEAMASSCPCIVADTGGLRESSPTTRSACASRAATPSRSRR